MMILDSFEINISEAEILKEKEKAREIRKSRWWKNRIATGICHYCGKKFDPDGLTMDHILPIIRGGKSTRGNLAVACKSCNSKKKYLLPIEWNEYLEMMDKNNE